MLNAYTIISLSKKLHNPFFKKKTKTRCFINNLFPKNTFWGSLMFLVTPRLCVWEPRAGLLLLHKRLARYRCFDTSLCTYNMPEHVGGHIPLSRGRVQSGVRRGGNLPRPKGARTPDRGSADFEVNV